MAGVIYLIQSLEETVFSSLCHNKLWSCENSPEENHLFFIGGTLAGLAIVYFSLQCAIHIKSPSKNVITDKYHNEALQGKVTDISKTILS